MIHQMTGAAATWQVTDAARRVMAEDARLSYPAEGCGWLLGPAPGVVTVAVPVRNEAGATRAASRYLMGPDSYRAAARQAQAAGCDIVGVFHSHPDHPPRPSVTDLAEAWPAWLYVIVPVVAGSPGEPLGWQLQDDRDGFTAVTLARSER